MQTATRWFFGAVACVSMMTAAAPASAGTIGIKDSTLIFGADLGEQIALTASTTPTDLILVGPTFDIVTPGCVADGANSVRCARSGFTSAIVIGSELDDVVTLSDVDGVNFFVATKDGNDILVGGKGDDILSAGNGDDILIAGPPPGHDKLFRGAGNDVVIGPSFAGNEPDPPDPQPLLHPAPVPVPEPATMMLVGLGLGASAIRRARARKTVSA